MKYNTAVGSRGIVPREKKILNTVFTGNGLTVFQHDICMGVAPEFRNCDAIHTEISWVAGYKKFTQGSIAEDTTFDEYCSSVSSLCRELKVPAFIVCGKQNAKKLKPDRIIPVRYEFHKIDALYAIFNYDGEFSPRNEYEGRDFVASHFDDILDPCCGFGIIAYDLRRYQKRGVLTDINATCLEYINERFILGKTA